MLLRCVGTLAGGMFLLALLSIAHFAVPAHALSAKECSVKYKAAKAAGTLGDMKWNAFRKAHCGAKSAAATSGKKKLPTPRLVPAATGSAVFPSAISPKYRNESQGKARMHTCRDQYESNKARNANGGLRWVQKGGGYYSQCNKRLKG